VLHEIRAFPSRPEEGGGIDNDRCIELRRERLKARCKIRGVAESGPDHAILDGLQPDTFALATLSFQATAAGTSTLNLSSAVVGDRSGSALSVETLGSTDVTAGGGPAIPEPRGLLLFAIGFATVVVFGAARARDGS
jgi:hypothetical protein